MIFERIQKLCNKKNITIYGLEKEMGFSPSCIRKWKKSTPAVGKLKKIADYFGVSVEYFLEETEGGD